MQLQFALCFYIIGQFAAEDGEYNEGRVHDHINSIIVRTALEVSEQSAAQNEKEGEDGVVGVLVFPEVVNAVYAADEIHNSRQVPKVEERHRQHEVARDIKYVLEFGEAAYIRPHAGMYFCSYKEQKYDKCQ